MNNPDQRGPRSGDLLTLRPMTGADPALATVTRVERASFVATFDGRSYWRFDIDTHRIIGPVRL